MNERIFLLLRKRRESGRAEAVDSARTPEVPMPRCPRGPHRMRAAWLCSARSRGRELQAHVVKLTEARGGLALALLQCESAESGCEELAHTE